MKNDILKLPCKRVLLKVSGETLLGPSKIGIDNIACKRLASILNKIHEEGFQVGLVIGGGNIFRGIKLKETGIERTPADQMGMLATIINGLAIQQALQNEGCPARVLSAIDCPKVVESYTWRKSLEYLDRGEVVIFVGGTGNPYFTTDTAAALRACEIHADILLKATKVDGIYNKDPLKYSDAMKYSKISYSQYLAEKLEIMDSTAIALCMSNKIPIFVFNMHLMAKIPISKLLLDDEIGTLVNGH